MKIIFYFGLMLLQLWHSIPTPREAQSKNIILTIKLAGRYDLPQNISNKNNSYVYFLVELNIINKSDSCITFVAYNCATGGNIVSESKDIFICSNACSGNSLVQINLNPDQIFNFPAIIQIEDQSDIINKEIRLGFIVLNPKKMNALELISGLEQCRKNHENIIWSQPFTLFPEGIEPFRILNIATEINQ